MKKVIILLFLVPLLSSPDVYPFTLKSGILDVIPQKDKRNDDSEDDKKLLEIQDTKDSKNQVKKNYKEDKILISSDNWENDTLYYKNITREGLWYQGMGNSLKPGEITAEDTIYRFTMKLDNGNYMHVEALKGGKKITSEIFRAFISPFNLKEYDIDEDIISNSEWIDSQNNIVEVFLIPSSDLNSVIAEKAYDNEHKIVHTANIENITDQKAVVCYFNSQGNILNLTNPMRYDFGTIAIYEWNHDNNSKITITDLSGWPIAKL